MLHFIKYIIICIHIFCITLVPGYRNCVTNYKIGNRIFDDKSPPPANLTQSRKPGISGNNKTIIEVWVKGRAREDFYLTLLANPFKENAQSCDPQLRVDDKNLRQYFKTCTIFKNKEEIRPRIFEMIFTGCYYFMMTNKEGKNWRLDPVFYKTNYTYLDTQITVKENTIAKPADVNTSIKLITELKIPLPCLQLKAVLYELEKETRDPIGDIGREMIPISQECMMKKGDVGEASNCGTSSLITNITLNVSTDEVDDGWTAEFVWMKLQTGGGQYYLHFFPDLNSCRNLHRVANVDTWRPLVEKIWIPYGLAEGNNAPENPITITKGFLWVLIVTVVAALTVVAMLIYWILKFRQLAMVWKTRRENEVFEKSEEGVWLCDEKEYSSNMVLLMYIKGSSLFMKNIRSLRVRLEQDCDCHVHDLYATNEWPKIDEIGATGWVEQLLRGGSKVVWLDTPQFRSCLNNKEKFHTVDDSRDEAVPYAVALATNLFQNATTQYQLHFVIRMRGFEVEDRQDDPLLVVSPYVRYYIPDHLSLLCEHLRWPMKRLETKGKCSMTAAQ